MRPRFSWIISVILILCTITAGCWTSEMYFRSPSKDQKPITVEIPAGSSVTEIGDILQEKEIISRAWLFNVFVRINGLAERLQAGEFDFTPNMSHASVATVLTGSGISRDVLVTIPEGFMLVQTGERVREVLPQITEADWKAVTGPNSELLNTISFLSVVPKGIDLEGYLFPDTYRFSRDASVDDVVFKMIANLERRLNEVGIDPRSKNITRGLDLHELLTLASIVEKEVRQPDSMKRVADIFLRRLQIGMALQADSTVNYITGGTDPSVSLSDLEIDSLYNTYKYRGLPPGPISNPGLNAIQAVLSPEKNDYLYFLTTSAGEVVYSKTFDEHVANKNKYLR